MANFIRHWQTFSQSSCIIFHSLYMRVPVALYLASTHNCHVLFFNNCFIFLKVMQWYFNVVLIFIFLITNIVNIFYVFICHSSVFSDEVSVQMFCPFFIWVFIFLLLTFKSSLCILDTIPLLDMCFCKYFLPIYGSSLNCLSISSYFFFKILMPGLHRDILIWWDWDRTQGLVFF